MKRSLVQHACAATCAALLACNTTTIEQPDSGPDPIQITPQSLVVVTPGTTTSIELVVVGEGDSAATITIGPLPSGLSAPTFAWTGQSPVTVELTAEADVPVTEVIANVTATVNGTVVGTAPMTIDVSSLDGALDPTFGTGGFWTLPVGTSARPTAIASVANDAWLIAGSFEDTTGVGSVVLARVSSNGGLDASYANGGVRGSVMPGRCVSADVDANGDAIILAYSGESTAATIDATGVIGTISQSTTDSSLIAWDGTGAFALGTSLVHFDASLTPTSFPIVASTPSALLVNGGAAYLGIESSGNVVEKWSLESPNVYSLDPTFGGEDGATDLPTEPTGISKMAIDAQGRLLVGFADVTLTLERLLPDGTPDSTFGTDGIVIVDPRQTANITPVGIFPLSDGSILVAAYLEPTGSTDTGANTGVLLTHLDESGVPSSSFGTYGISRTELTAPLAVAGAAYDPATNRLCVVCGNDALVPSIVMACYHVEP